MTWPGNISNDAFAGLHQSLLRGFFDQIKSPGVSERWVCCLEHGVEDTSMLLYMQYMHPGLLPVHIWTPGVKEAQMDALAGWRETVDRGPIT